MWKQFEEVTKEKEGKKMVQQPNTSLFIAFELLLVIQFAQLVGIHSIRLYLTKTGLLRLVRDKRIDQQEQDHVRLGNCTNCTIA
jgi:replication fork clamp-binding protein CrfC